MNATLVASVDVATSIFTDCRASRSLSGSQLRMSKSESYSDNVESEDSIVQMVEAL
jgi:hypothetical protein